MIIAAIISSYFVRKPFEEAAVLIENAEADSQIKSSFLSNLSYEVRTPLDRILEHSEFVLADDGLSDETKDSIEIIFSSGMEILGTINDILDITKIESGNFEIYPDQYDTSDLINDMIALNIARIEEKPIVFKILVDERLPGVLYGDDLRVKQVFNNLLSNAFKYTDTGTVEWKITFEKEGDSVWIVSSVQDTGIGMAPEDVKSLFLDYNQEDFISNHKEEGAGLGLAITKRLVETMGGQITVESEQKKGSKFSVRMRQTFVSDIPVGKEIAEDFMGLYYSLSKHNKYMKMTYVNLAYEYILVVDNSVAFANEVEGMIRYWDRDETCGTEQVEVGIMDRERLLERFNGDKEVLYDVLKSYVSGTRVLLHDINKYLEDGELDKYIIAVHGIKGSSYGVFEQETGNAAAKLEAAAKAGDMDTIRDNHEAFAENTKGLLDMIEKNLDEINDNNRKPMKKMPDLERLVKLQNACQKYDIDGVDSIIEQLEAYHYEKGGEFVSWLREQVNHMDLDRIAVLDIQKISELWEDNGRSRKKVLLVHDSGTMLRNVKGWLEDKYDIFPVKSGTAAIKYLSKNRPDVIFLDDEMTAAGGMKISEIICEEVEYAEPLILSFTGKWNRESINKAIKEFF